MDVKILNRSLIQRIFGIPATPKPQNPNCWTFNEGKLVVDLRMAGELQKPGGALRLEGRGLPRRVLVIRDEDGRLHAFHNRCTHLGHRRLDPVPGTATVQCCSVNKSTYAYDGHKIRGPAPASLTTYPTRIEGNSLLIHLA
jgi:nitrite reductase/ring-hydroxylating ferredoxin subunit